MVKGVKYQSSGWINRKNYELAKNEYVKMIREEEQKHEIHLIDKCGEELKLFYRYNNKKFKSIEGTVLRMRDNNGTYAEPLEMSHLFKEIFQDVTKESNSEPSQRTTEGIGIEEIAVKKMISQMLEKLWTGKLIRA